MSRNLKALGLALASVFALSAVMASAAQATEFFHSEQQNTILTGASSTSQEFKLGPGLPAVVCSSANFAGTEVATGGSGSNWTTPSVTVHPEYSGCVISGHAASVSTNNCHYKLFAETTATTGIAAMANVQLLCPAKITESEPTGKPTRIEISVPDLGIVISVNPATFFHGVSYTNEGSGSTRTTTVVATVGTNGAGEAGKPAQIAWECTTGGAACTAAFGVKKGTEATYTGSTKVTGFEDTGAADTGTYNEGNQIGIWKE